MEADEAEEEMRGVRVIPDKYRDGWERVFCRTNASRGLGQLKTSLPNDCQIKESREVRYDIPVRVSFMVANPFTGEWFGWVL